MFLGSSKKLSCDEETELVMPMEGIEVFQHINMVDEGPRKEIILALNSIFETGRNQEIKNKYQIEICNLIKNAAQSGKIETQTVSPIFTILVNGNYSSFE